MGACYIASSSMKAMGITMSDVLCTRAFDRVQDGSQIVLVEVWCVCLKADPEARSDETACGFVTLPGRRQYRTPTCEDCLRELARRREKEQRSGMSISALSAHTTRLF
jgi:hypothetical protein